MENQFIWGVTFIVAMIIFLPYVIKHRNNIKKDRLRDQEAKRLGADKTIAQHPQIDALTCIGCGSCVAACPEGEVLGIVSGKAVIINGLKCVGHGLCAEACPVEGITIGLGDTSKRTDIPQMDEHNQTNIPGLFIAGELGGLALIKNAISQGNKVVEYISENIIPLNDPLVKDILIVGAGPAGMSAALTAKEKNLSFEMIDQQGSGGTILQYPRKKLVMTKPVTIPLYGTLSKPEYPKEELLAIWDEISIKYEINPKVGVKLKDLKKDINYFEVYTDKGVHWSQNVVLAMGRRGTPRKLGVPGEEQPKVMYKLIDAESYQKNHILVVGGGDSAIEAAMGLARQKGNKVTLSYRKDTFFRIKKRNETRITEMIEKKSLNVIFNSVVKNIGKDEVILFYDDHETKLKNDFVFIFAGGEPPFDLLKKIGINFGSSQN